MTVATNTNTKGGTIAMIDFDLKKAFPEDLFIEEEPLPCKKAFLFGIFASLGFFAGLIVCNFGVSGLLWAVITRGL